MMCCPPCSGLPIKRWPLGSTTQGCQETGSAVPALAECDEKVEAHCVKLSQVDDHLRQIVVTARGKEVPPEDPTGPDWSSDVGRFEQVLVDERLGIQNDGYRHHRGLPIRQVTRLCQDQYPGGDELDLILIDIVQVVASYEG